MIPLAGKEKYNTAKHHDKMKKIKIQKSKNHTYF